MSSSLPPQNSDADLFAHAAALESVGASKPARSADAPPAPISSQPALNDAPLDDLAGDRLLTDRAVADLFSVSRQTIWRWVRTIEPFPKAIQVSPGTSRWRLSDIRSFMAGLGKQSRKEGAK